MSQQFAAVNNAANEGAFGNNPRPEPTLAQLAAGNYKKGHVTLHGLNIAIENPAFSYRQGVDANGQKWSCLMQAHYGYIKGFKGNDGDEMDVFVGHVPESDTAYIVNQKKQGGYFDEHKIMLGFLSQQQAIDTYQHCFERGWTGLMSVVPCTIEQLKWWLANGDKSRPISVNRLPYAGLERLDSVIWGGNDGDDLASHSGQVHKLLYQIRQCDNSGHALEPMLFTDMVQELGGQGFVYENYDALVTEYNKLERKAQQLLAVMQAATTAVKPVRVVVSKPLTKNGVTNVVAWFEMDDGQAVGVFFHNPDKNPKKLDPTDEMISYKWVLNKKDITIVVAPEQGKDLNIRTVAKRIMQLVDKNHDRFMKANSAKAELNQKEQDLNNQVAQKQAELSTLEADIKALEVKKAEKENAIKENQTASQMENNQANQEVENLRKQVLALAVKNHNWNQFMMFVIGKKVDDVLYQADFGVKGEKSEITVMSRDGKTNKETKHFETIGLAELISKNKLDDAAYEFNAQFESYIISQQPKSVILTEKGTASNEVEYAEEIDFLIKQAAIYDLANQKTTPKEREQYLLEDFASRYAMFKDDVKKNAELMNLVKDAARGKLKPVSQSNNQAKDKKSLQDRPTDYRTNLANARAVAKSLGIETKGKKLQTLLKEIEIFDNNEMKKELLAEFQVLASRLVLPKGYMFDLSKAEQSIGDITSSTSAWIRKQGKIDTNTIRVELRTNPDSSQGVIFNSVHIYTDDQKTKREFDKFNYQNFDSIGRSRPETPKEIIAKMEDFLTQVIFPRIEYLKVANGKELDPSKLSELGLANIESIGDENLYIEKDGKYYHSKVGNTDLYAEGEWDFAKYPDGLVSTKAQQSSEAEPTPTTSEPSMTDFALVTFSSWKKGGKHRIYLKVSENDNAFNEVDYGANDLGYLEVVGKGGSKKINNLSTVSRYSQLEDKIIGSAFVDAIQQYLSLKDIDISEFNVATLKVKIKSDADVLAAKKAEWEAKDNAEAQEKQSKQDKADLQQATIKENIDKFGRDVVVNDLSDAVLGNRAKVDAILAGALMKDEDFNSFLSYQASAKRLASPNPDRDYLQSIIDGDADLSSADEIEAKLTDISERLDADLEPLFEQAAEAFAQYAIAQAATV